MSEETSDVATESDPFEYLDHKLTEKFMRHLGITFTVGRLTLEEMDLKDYRHQTREAVIDKEHAASLNNGMKELNSCEYLVVYRRPDGKYAIVCGYHRMSVILEMRLGYVMAYVIDSQSGVTLEDLQTLSTRTNNNHLQELPKYRERRAVQFMRKHMKREVKRDYVVPEWAVDKAMKMWDLHQKERIVDLFKKSIVLEKFRQRFPNWDALDEPSKELDGLLLRLFVCLSEKMGGDLFVALSDYVIEVMPTCKALDKLIGDVKDLDLDVRIPYVRSVILREGIPEEKPCPTTKKKPVKKKRTLYDQVTAKLDDLIKVLRLARTLSHLRGPAAAVTNLNKQLSDLKQEVDRLDAN